MIDFNLLKKNAKMEFAKYEEIQDKYNIEYIKIKPYLDRNPKVFIPEIKELAKQCSEQFTICSALYKDLLNHPIYIHMGINFSIPIAIERFHKVKKWTKR